MKLWIIALLILSASSFLYADNGDQSSSVNPRALLKSTNTWTAAQINVGAYPDWIVDGTFHGTNVKWKSPLYFNSLDLDGDLYILNLYTEPE